MCVPAAADWIVPVVLLYWASPPLVRISFLLIFYVPSVLHHLQVKRLYVQIDKMMAIKLRGSVRKISISKTSQTSCFVTEKVIFPVLPQKSGLSRQVVSELRLNILLLVHPILCSQMRGGV